MYWPIRYNIRLAIKLDSLSSKLYEKSVRSDFGGNMYNHNRRILFYSIIFSNLRMSAYTCVTLLVFM